MDADVADDVSCYARSQRLARAGRLAARADDGGDAMLDLNPHVKASKYILCLIAVCACGGRDVGRRDSNPADAHPTVLRAAAASDLIDVLPAWAQAFEAKTGVAVQPTFGSSGKLAEQIRAGAPYDVFLSADRALVESLARDGAILNDSARPYAVGRLALAVRSDLASRLRTLDDLKRPEVKVIAVANPDVAPYGRAARATLTHAKLWDVLHDKVVLVENVRQALQHVESGDADAAFVSRSAVPAGAVSFVNLDPSAYEPIVQTLGVVARSASPGQAEEFARFILSDEGRAILLAFGFDAPAISPQAHPAAGR